jgi:hypothetical protein
VNSNNFSFDLKKKHHEDKVGEIGWAELTLYLAGIVGRNEESK